MSTQAISSYGIQVRLGDGLPLAGLTINAATNATPIVVTTTAPHGVVDVSHATVTGVVGNTGANGVWVVERVSATQLKLRQSAGTGAYTSGGTLVLDSTYATIAELRDVRNIGFTLRSEDCSAHDGAGWASSIPIMLQAKPMTLDLNLVPAHATHDGTTGLIALAEGRIRRPYFVVFPNTTKAALHFYAFVQDHGSNFPIGVLRAQPVLQVVDTMTWSRS